MELSVYLLVCSFVHFFCFCLIFSRTHYTLSPSRFQAGFWGYGDDQRLGLVLGELTGSWGTLIQTQITREQRVFPLPPKLTSLQSLFSPLHILAVSSHPCCAGGLLVLLQMELVSTEGWLHRESMAQLGLLLLLCLPKDTSMLATSQARLCFLFS